MIKTCRATSPVEQPHIFWAKKEEEEAREKKKRKVRPGFLEKEPSPKWRGKGYRPSVTQIRDAY